MDEDIKWMYARNAEKNIQTEGIEKRDFNISHNNDIARKMKYMKLFNMHRNSTVVTLMLRVYKNIV